MKQSQECCSHAPTDAVAKRTATPTKSATLLDQELPFYEFRGRVSVPVAASPAEIFRALREVTLTDMPMARLLGALRYLPGRLLGRTAPAAPRSSFLAQLLSSGNIALAEKPSHELVVGAIGKFHRILNQQFVLLQNASQFHDFGDPEYQKLAMSFRVEAGSRGSVLTLEHRTHALGAGSRRAFALYWVIIRPTSHFVSWLLLRAVRRRAEHHISVPAPTLGDRPRETFAR